MTDMRYHAYKVRASSGHNRHSTQQTTGYKWILDTRNKEYDGKQSSTHPEGVWTAEGNTYRSVAKDEEYNDGGADGGARGYTNPRPSK